MRAVTAPLPASQSGTLPQSMLLMVNSVDLEREFAGAPLA